MEGIIVILIVIWILRLITGSGKKAAKRREDQKQEYYGESYRMFYGKDPDHRLSAWEMAELDELEDEEYEED